ncbi:hypothetical protein [uncultured Methanoregula sp.]|uniref:hypothetical protein n=1 Tax=uncultured Methanoregula sp. TaxID=1005933 RepID=UPI002AABE7C2|nr:hypothetical protein [uncultured Methanoregula sp.]
MSALRLRTIRFMLAVGSILLVLAAVAPVTGYDSSSCSPGYYTYSTSDGQCCPEGYPYYYDGHCHQCRYGSVYDSHSGTCCPEGYPYYYDGTCHQCRYGSVYDSYSGSCCPGDTPQYYDGACHACRYGYKQYSTSNGNCCPEGYPYYYDGTCHAMSESATIGTGVSIPEVNNVPAVFSTAPTPTPEPAPVVIIVNVPATPTKTPLPPVLPVLGIGILCVIWAGIRKKR